jgi:putative transposase
MRGFKTPGYAQRFLSSMEASLNLLKAKRYSVSAKEYRQKLKEAVSIFHKIVVSHP